MRLPAREWAKRPENQGLLYFCQLLDDMVWDGTRDSYRAPSLNTYHRCHEILRTMEEIRDSALREGILSPMFDELILLGASDPTVKRHFDSNWQELAFSFEKGGLQNKTFAVMRFLRRIDTAYLKRCRDEIQRIVDLGECKEKDRLERLAGDFCSYLLNVGHSSAQIKYVVNTRFFSRELEFPAKREVQDFFAEFPCRTNLFDVYSFTSSDLAQFLEGNSSQVVTGKVPPPVAGRYAAFIESAREFQIVVSRGVEAFDPSDARLRTEAAMALTRAIAYTARPHLTLGWKPESIVCSQDNVSGIFLGERPAPLRRRYRSSDSFSVQAIELRRKTIFAESFTGADRNRMQNAIIGYSNAFHSESLATQLITVWSSLEGLLPPVEGENHIEQMTSAALDCQTAMYLKNAYQWAFTTHSALDQRKFFEIIDGVPEYKNRLAKFVAALSFEEYRGVSDDLGAFAAVSPLTTQRGYRLHAAASKISDLWKLVENHRQKVAWQIRRIYRERNRIVHRASPSANSETLLLNLNEYFLVCLDALFGALSSSDGKASLDEIFNGIAIGQQNRERWVRKLGKERLTKKNANLVLGFELE
jgi:hypothetical protein